MLSTSQSKVGLLAACRLRSCAGSFPLLRADPANGKTLGFLRDMTLDDAQRAVQQAWEAFRTFSHSTPQNRADILQRFHALTLAHMTDLATLITLENGKALRDSLGEVAYGASYLQWNSGEALRMYGRTIPSSLPGTRNFTVLEVCRHLRAE